MQAQASAHQQGGDAALQSASGSIADAENGHELQEQANADNGWDEHVCWDFQDVPLDSPRAGNKHVSPDHGNRAQDPGVPASRMSPNVSASSVSADSRNSQGQMAALQQENKTLRQRLKRVEAVSVESHVVPHVLHQQQCKALGSSFCIHAYMQTTP